MEEIEESLKELEKFQKTKEKDCRLKRKTQGEYYMEYEEIEDFVFNNDTNAIREKYASKEDDTKESWDMAIMTAIAIGDRQDLEKEFPESAGANPGNHNWD